MVNFLYEGDYALEESDSENDNDNDKRIEPDRENDIDKDKKIEPDSEKGGEQDSTGGVSKEWRLRFDWDTEIARLCRHVTINSAADYYQIADLCELSTKKLDQDLDWAGPYCALLPVIRFALKESPNKALHNMLAKMAANLLCDRTFNSELCQSELPHEFQALIFKQCCEAAHSKMLQPMIKNHAFVERRKKELDARYAPHDCHSDGWGQKGSRIEMKGEGYCLVCLQCGSILGDFTVPDWELEVETLSI